MHCNNQTIVLNSTLLKRCALNVALLVGLMPLLANANPTGASIVSGQVSIDTTTTPHKTTITNSPNAIINWQNFSIAQNETTQFIQQSSQSAVLNRVVGQNPSQILGQLYSNGKVFLINPNGIVFGQGATVDVQGLIASSLNLSDQDFLNGNNYHFIAGSNNGSIVNEGIIRAGTDGNILLIAPQIQNSGIIQSNGGNITLAAGQEMTLTSLVNPDIRFQIQAPANSVLNLGQLLSEGGEINVFASTITHSGAINADSVQKDKQGNIQLVAQQAVTLTAGSIISANNSQGNAGTIVIDSKTDTTLVQGDIQAQATGQTGQGGSIQVLGQQLVLNNATINASGQNGGGQILVGGDQHGANASVQNAQTTVVDQFSNIKADAISKGNGGKVIVWSDKNTHVGGTLSVQGGSSSGNGGFIETSGAKLNITSTANISTSAPKGTTGTWLLDPADFTIALNDSTISGANLATELTKNNILIEAYNKIFVNDSVYWVANTLTLQAPDIYIANFVTLGGHDQSLNAGTLALNGTTTLSGGTIQNVTLTSNASMSSDGHGGTLDGVTIGSNLNETGSYHLNINNNLLLAKDVTVNMGASNWHFNTSNSQIKALGAATVIIAGGNLWGNSGLTIGSGVTLQGSGSLNGSAIVNDGTIIASPSSPFYIASTSFTNNNDGTIIASPWSTFNIASTSFTNNGVMNILSGANLSGATLSDYQSNTFTNNGIVNIANEAYFFWPNDFTNAATGVIKASGTIGASTLNNYGTLETSASPGTMNLIGNLTMYSGSKLNAKLDANSNDNFIVTGDIDIQSGAILNVSHVNGFNGAVGHPRLLLETTEGFFFTNSNKFNTIYNTEYTSTSLLLFDNTLTTITSQSMVSNLINTLNASVLGTAPLMSYGLNSPNSFADIIVATDQKLLQCN